MTTFGRLTAASVSTALTAAGIVAAASTGAHARTASLDWTLASTVVVVGGMGWETVDEPVMREILDSRYDTPENTFVNIEWPAYLGTLGNSVSEASDSLYAHVMSTEGHQIAIGVSGSTFVANEVMRRLAEDPSPDKPTPEDISFVIIGDGERGIIPAVVPFTGWDLPLVNYTAQPIPVTAYDAIVVKGEYDGLADWPDRPWNLLAVANALAGSPAIDYAQIHWKSIWFDLETVPAENITTEVNAAGGTTTTYLVPTAEIPLLFPLHEMGVPDQVIRMFNAILKPIVDAGYRRNDPWVTAANHEWSRPSAKLPAPAGRAAAGAAAPVPAPVSTTAPATEERSTPSLSATARRAVQIGRVDARRPAGDMSAAATSGRPTAAQAESTATPVRSRGAVSRAAAR